MDPIVSVIIPTCNEWPQIVFTIRSIAEELIDRIPFEIIVIDNYCPEVEQQGRLKDLSSDHLKNVEKGHSWLRILQYQDKLSHWQCKNYGVHESKGKFLFFSDAHCMIGKDALVNMIETYTRMIEHEGYEGTLHLPLTYHILEWHKLIYKLNCRPEYGKYHYSFTPYRDHDSPFEVPVMSTCGMLMTRKLYDKFGGWPEHLGIYGGGENFINFTLAIMGLKKSIMPGRPLYHHGDKRGYEWNYDDHLENQACAHYMFGGKKLLEMFLGNSNGRSGVKGHMQCRILKNCCSHRQHIKAQQVIEIKEWYEKWTKT